MSQTTSLTSPRPHAAFPRNPFPLFIPTSPALNLAPNSPYGFPLVTPTSKALPHFVFKPDTPQNPLRTPQPSPQPSCHPAPYSEKRQLPAVGGSDRYFSQCYRLESKLSGEPSHWALGSRSQPIPFFYSESDRIRIHKIGDFMGVNRSLVRSFSGIYLMCWKLGAKITEQLQTAAGKIE